MSEQSKVPACKGLLFERKYDYCRLECESGRECAKDFAAGKRDSEVLSLIGEVEVRRDIANLIQEVSSLKGDAVESLRLSLRDLENSVISMNARLSFLELPAADEEVGEEEEIEIEIGEEEVEVEDEEEDEIPIPDQPLPPIPDRPLSRFFRLECEKKGLEYTPTLFRRFRGSFYGGGYGHKIPHASISEHGTKLYSEEAGEMILEVFNEWYGAYIAPEKSFSDAPNTDGDLLV